MKIPEPRKLKSGSYFIQLRLNGVSVPVTASTAKECKRQAELIKAEHRSGKTVIKRKVDDLTLGEVVREYIDSRKQSRSPSTIRGYEMYKKERFKAYQSKKLSSINWQMMLDEEGKIVSEKTVKNAWGLVHAALKYKGYPLPGNLVVPEVPIREIAFLQPEEISALLKAIKDKPYEIPLLLELHGLRLSEVQGLTWDNVDLKKGIINVRGAKVRSLTGYEYKETNKTRESTRPVPIMISQLQDALAKVENKTGAIVSISPPALLADVKRACKKAGVTEVTNHGLRHSFASLCYHLGISERQTMAWGGWSDYQTMHKIYIRLSKSAETENLKTIRAFFENAN